jgi:DNA-binding MarR family transcriptional regulator
MNSDFLQKLDRVIHEPARMAIMSLLAATPELAFTEIRDTLNMTDGNLSVQIKTLQEAGYLAVTKSYQESRPRTTCSLTSAGRKAFAGYVETLGRIIEQTKTP